MPKPPIGDDVPAEMTVGHEVEAVSKDDETQDRNEGLSDGLENLRSAYQEFWSETHQATPPLTPENTDLTNIPGQAKLEPEENESFVVDKHAAHSKHHLSIMPGIPQTKVPKASRQVRRRFGLPENFVPRMQRFGRGVLLELNIYQLPTGQEFLPCLPTGPLGSRHLYALLSVEQYVSGKRGSVYVRGDGRIFDYSVVSTNPLGDMFDTGYTIYDLERTGRYAPKLAVRRQVPVAVGRVARKRKKKTQQRKYRRTAAAG